MRKRHDDARSRAASRETVTYPRSIDFAEAGPFLDFSTDARVQASSAQQRRERHQSFDLRCSISRTGSHATTAVRSVRCRVRRNAVRPNGASTRKIRYALGACLTHLRRAARRTRRRGRRRRSRPRSAASIGFGSDLTLQTSTPAPRSACRRPKILQYPGYSNPFLQPERSQSFDATIACLVTCSAARAPAGSCKPASNSDQPAIPTSIFRSRSDRANRTVDQRAAVVGRGLRPRARSAPFVSTASARAHEHHRHLSRTRLRRRLASRTSRRPAGLLHQPRHRLYRCAGQHARRGGCGDAHRRLARCGRRRQLHHGRCLPTAARGAACARVAARVRPRQRALSRGGRLSDAGAAPSRWNSRHASPLDGDRDPRAARGTLRARRRRHGTRAARSVRGTAQPGHAFRRGNDRVVAALAAHRDRRGPSVRRSHSPAR